MQEYSTKPVTLCQVNNRPIFCRDCGADFQPEKISDFAQFFPSQERWVPVSERLPHTCSVLGFIVNRPRQPGFVMGDPFVDTVTYFPKHDPQRLVQFAADIPDAGEWRLNGCDEDDDRGVVTVTHWQPLPAPPEPGDAK